MIDKQRLEAKCSTWNITLTGTQLDQLDAFAEILVNYISGRAISRGIPGNPPPVPTSMTFVPG